MRFVKVPDTLPAPQSYLRQGLTRPTQQVGHGPARRHDVAAPDALPDLDGLPSAAGPGGHTVTLTTGGTVPVGVLEAPSHRFLSRPAARDAIRADVMASTRHSSGVLDLTLGARHPLTHTEWPAPVDLTTARVVTVDLSVVLAGLDAEAFGAKDALFVSAATAVLYDAPMYTTKPDAYAGLGLGLKVIPYRAVGTS